MRFITGKVWVIFSRWSASREYDSGVVGAQQYCAPTVLKDLITATLFFRRDTIGNSGSSEITVHLCECTGIKQKR
jgi:hypothetical protein